jgi:hypothetical protein
MSTADDQSETFRIMNWAEDGMKRALERAQHDSRIPPGQRIDQGLHDRMVLGYLLGYLFEPAGWESDMQVAAKVRGIGDVLRRHYPSIGRAADEPDPTA